VALLQLLHLDFLGPFLVMHGKYFLLVLGDPFLGYAVVVAFAKVLPG